MQEKAMAIALAKHSPADSLLSMSAGKLVTNCRVPLKMTQIHVYCTFHVYLKYLDKQEVSIRSAY